MNVMSMLVCGSVCLSSVCEHISETTVQTPNLTKCSVHVTRGDEARFSSGGIAIRCTSGYVDDVTSSHNGPYGGTLLPLQ